MSLVMNTMAAVASFVVAMTWVWFLLFPLVIVAVGLKQVMQGVVRGYETSGVAGAIAEIREVLCPSTGEHYAVEVSMASGVATVTRCPRFGNGPVTCGQACLHRS